MEVECLDFILVQGKGVASVIQGLRDSARAEMGGSAPASGPGRFPLTFFLVLSLCCAVHPSRLASPSFCPFYLSLVRTRPLVTAAVISSLCDPHEVKGREMLIWVTCAQAGCENTGTP